MSWHGTDPITSHRARRSAAWVFDNGGEGGIRTPGPLRVNGFQDRRFRPLSHLSIFIHSTTYSLPKTRLFKFATILQPEHFLQPAAREILPDFAGSTYMLFLLSFSAAATKPPATCAESSSARRSTCAYVVIVITVFLWSWRCVLACLCLCSVFCCVS